MNTLEAMRELVSRMPKSSFTPKLTEGERVALYAMYMQGAHTMDLAKVFGIHRNTVHHIITRDSSRYKKTREIYYGIGGDEAFKRYVTPGMIEKLTTLNDEKRMTPATDRDEPDAKASQRKGEWTNRDGETYTVNWVQDGPFGTGWYPLFENSPVVDGGREAPYFTSTEAYRAGKRL